MRLWPRRKPKVETREGFGDLLLQLLNARADGDEADLLGVAAVEAVAGAVSRAFTACVVEGAQHVVDALTPSVLARVGRDLVRHGESLHVVHVGRTVSLLPAASWTVQGGPAPSSWLYDVTMDGPTRMAQRVIPNDGVVFVAGATEAARPHEGRSAASYASNTARTASRSERAVGDEAGGPVGSVVALPEGDQETFDRVAAAVGKLRGEVIPVETTASAWGEGRDASPKRDWTAQRIGGAVPDGSIRAREAAQDGLVGALGGSVSLFSDADGTAQREAIRRFTLLTTVPLLRLLRAEVVAKLEGACRFRYDPQLTDISGRAGALKALVEAGVSLAEAREIVGLGLVGIVE